LNAGGGCPLGEGPGYSLQSFFAGHQKDIRSYPSPGYFNRYSYIRCKIALDDIINHRV
jgi:hypothetical protein